ncbi:sulfotransferase [Nitratireductor sp. ZSWI3]|uniref:sulfotransferase family protein n=1 Tax=Nitratireductor sp. ZSWI3 TaxID=2966359 RepID=UPI00214F7843|nr:sulfotransferase [Nitratireductor sp. ZSWI3]MCR4267613.1 sulfotransferase [Nitratireductor sp. ZSWI3]
MTTGRLKPPIFLIGNYRSGTTITQKLIGLHPDIVTWYEPRTLWRYADPARRHDEFDESDATEAVARYIRRRFLSFQMQGGNRRIMENTPSNVLRVPFVHRIFPEATYMFIVRNPFSCISSIELKWRKSKTWKGLVRSLSDAPTMQLPYYAREFLANMIVRKVRRTAYVPSYGPRYEGIDQDLEHCDKLQIAARQWAFGNRKARRDLARLGAGSVLTIRYEDLMEDTEAVLLRIYDHCGLACDDGILRAAKRMVDPGRQQKWLRLDKAALRAVLPEVSEEMALYGYEVPAILQ